jgi:hypothetical protein
MHLRIKRLWVQYPVTGYVVRFPMRLLAVIAVLCGVLALAGASAVSAAAHAAKTVTYYLYTGEGENKVIVSTSPGQKPEMIYTAHGTIIDEFGETLPAPYGGPGSTYPGWRGAGSSDVSLNLANLNSAGGTSNCSYGETGCAVIDDVIADTWGPLTGGDRYFKCIVYYNTQVTGSAPGDWKLTTEEYLYWPKGHSGKWKSIKATEANKDCING